MEQKDTGILIRKKNVNLQRFYFKQAVRLIGINVLYRAPRKNKKYNGYGELDTYFLEPINVGVIFEDHPNIWTMRKLGWDSELQEGETLIHVPYDTPNLESGGMLEVPSGLDDTPGKRFRILKMRTSMVYPSEVVCHIAPLFTSTIDNSQQQHQDNNFIMLKHRDDEQEEDED